MICYIAKNQFLFGNFNVIFTSGAELLWWSIKHRVAIEYRDIFKFSPVRLFCPQDETIPKARILPHML